MLAWKTTEKNMENFPGFPRYDAKHWANVYNVYPVAFDRTKRSNCPEATVIQGAMSIPNSRVVWMWKLKLKYLMFLTDREVASAIMSAKYPQGDVLSRTHWYFFFFKIPKLLICKTLDNQKPYQTT